MKSLLVLLLLSDLASLQAAEGLPDAGPHHRTVVVESFDEVGPIRESYVHLEPGLNRWEDGQWVPAEAGLEIVGDTVVARRTAHRVIWAGTAAGGVSIELPTGEVLRGACLGLSYFDAASGKSVLLTELKESVAEVHPPDIVIYRDAFDGDVEGDLLYVSRKGSFEQFVVLRSVPPPQEWDLDPATTRLEVISEFLEAPVPGKTLRVVRAEAEPALRALMAEPDLIDEELDFGSMFMSQGQAFLPAGDPAKLVAAESIPMAKRWQVIEGRTILFEAVEYPSLKPLLTALGNPAWNVAQGRQPTAKREFPVRQMASKSARPILMASSSPMGKGVYIDYTLSSGVTNYVFRGDTTYYVTAAINCGGTNTVFESGTVIKLAPTNNAHLDLASSAVTWQGTAYRPVIVTAGDDASVGVVATTNTLSGHYGTTALNFLSPLTSVSLAHVRVGHAQTAIAFSQGTGHTISHAQIVNCGKGLALTNAEVRLRNALMTSVSTNFDLTSATARVEHLTVNGASLLNTAGVLYLTNSLLVAVTATNGWSGVSNVFVASASGVFVSVGAGSHYLAPGSPYRDAGTTAIDANLQKHLKAMTTVAPVWIANAITTATTLGPQAARDVDGPDLGYHYPPLDYLVSNVTLQAALTLTNGVALGMCGTYGLSMQTGSRVWSEGTPLALNRMAGPALVQEQSVNLGQAKGMTLPGAYSPTIRLRFTDVSLKGGAKAVVFDPSTYGFTEFSMRDSWLRGGSFSASPNTTATVISALTNNIIERSDIALYHSLGSQHSGHTAYVFNNLFYNSDFVLRYDSGTNALVYWLARDNLFHGITPLGSGSGYSSFVTVSHNGFTSGTGNGLGGSSNKTNLVADFLSGSLGAYYYPTNGSGLNQLRNAGSRNAGPATLYHHTTTIDQVKEGSSVVDIGYHSVATDSNGLPLDADGDGVPDYMEDRNGNGTADSGESNWQVSNNGTTGTPGLVVYTPFE